jgi:hypothetical protein
LRNKASELQILLAELSPDVILGCETWLSPGEQDLAFPPSFTVFRSDRPTHGGGVLIAVRQELAAFPVLLSPSDIECCACVIPRRQGYLGFVSCYRLPSAQLSTLTTALQDSRLPLGRLFIAGDFNLPSLTWDSSAHLPASPDTSSVQDFMASFSLDQFVLSPTRGSHFLDLLFSNIDPALISCSVCPGLSDHKAVFAVVTLRCPHVRPPPHLTTLFSHADLASITSCLSAALPDFLAMPNSVPVDTHWLVFRDLLLKTFRDHTPTKLVQPPSDHPWLTNSCRRLLRRIRRKYRTMKLYGGHHVADYALLVSQTKDTLTEARNSFFSNLASAFLTDPRKFWRYAKGVSKSDQLPSALLSPTGFETDPTVKAHLLNSHFQSVFTVPSSGQLPPFPSRTPSTMPLVSLTEQGIQACITRLKPRAAAGPDGISPFMLQSAAEICSLFLLRIFKLSLSTGSLPADWKLATVIPVPKSGDKSLPANHRPISLTSIPCKILEHILCSCIHSHLSSCNLLSPAQFGFRKGASCELLHLNLQHFVTNTLDHGGQVDLVSLDLAKAFDTVDHRLLLHKLSAYGLSTEVLSWIASFLQGRSQRVSVNKCFSSPVDVLSGVPQGSSLAPLLFLLFVNDLPDLLSSHVLLYADDTTLAREISTNDDPPFLQQDIDILLHWCSIWSLCVNPSKSAVLTITRRHQEHVMYYPYTAGSESLPRVTVLPSLGLHLDSRWSWASHLRQMITRADRILRFTSHALKLTTVQCRLAAYRALVLPILDYCSGVWDPYTASGVSELESVQRRAVRRILRDFGRDVCITEATQNLNLVPLALRRRDHRLCLLHHISSGHTILPSDCYLSPPDHLGRHDHSAKFKLHTASRNFHKFSFFPRSVRDWNSLPSSVVPAASADALRLKLMSLHPALDCPNHP